MAANLYLLPCPQCQQPIQLPSRQAGQTVTCPQCNAAFEAPRLGQLKNLQQVSAEVDARPATAGGSVLKRWLFTLGLASAVLLGAAGFGLYQFAGSIESKVDPRDAVEAFQSDIAGLSDTEVYQIAASYDADATIGQYYQPTALKSKKQSEILKTIAYGLLGLAAVGTITLVSSFFVK